MLSELRSHDSAFTVDAAAQIDSAVRAGAASVDVLYAVPPNAGAAATALLALLGEADKYCHAEHLRTLAPPPEVLSFRRWFLGEFVNQTAGARPTPWLAHLARGATSVWS